LSARRSFSGYQIALAGISKQFGTSIFLALHVDRNASGCDIHRFSSDTREDKR